jgi:putative transcriptional regulator
MNHHPLHDYLEQYAAGTLPLPIALCVSVHLGFCAQCRTDVQALQALGGMLLDDLAAVPVPAAALHNVMARIDQGESTNPATVAVAAPVASRINVPQALRKLVPQGYERLQWSRVLPSLRIATLDTGCDDYQVTLHRVKAGGSVATHDHRGLEFTLVLNGSFSDEYGVYNDGDFILREPSQPHRPLAALNEECLCLAVQQAPVRFTGFFWRLLNPFLR